MKNYISLMRLDKPIGFMLLFWPCAWGFGLSLSNQIIDKEWITYLLLFFVGSILMRCAGCIYNDIIDRKIDKKVNRTKNRPIASNKISLTHAWILIFFLCFLSLAILFQFNLKAIIFGLSSGILILIYPFMKRISYWPQLFLGIVFNWGVILSWLVLKNDINFEIILLYISAIFWTLAYDTIYGLQDIEDDIKIGVKSTAIKFNKNIKKFLTICFAISFVLLVTSNALALSKINIILILYLIPIGLLIYQIQSIDPKNNARNLSLFKLNNYYGLSIFVIQILTFRYA